MLSIVLISLVASSCAIDAVSTSPGSSLRHNNPILLPFMLGSALLASFQGGVVEAQVNNPNDDDISNTIVTGVVLDDDDDGGFSRDLEDRFEDVPDGWIQFEPRTYSSITGVAIAVTLLALWAAFDISSPYSLSSAKLDAIRKQSGQTGILSYIMALSFAIMRPIVIVAQLAFLVVTAIYIVQPMWQWTVINNNNGTQNVIAREGFFVVTPGSVATITEITNNIVPTNYPPFRIFTGSLAGIGANSYIVQSPSPIHIRDTWYLYIVFSFCIAHFFWNFSSALMLRGLKFTVAAVVAFIAWAGWVAGLVFAGLELGDLNAGQKDGEEIAALILAIVMVFITTVWFAYAATMAWVMRADALQNILTMSDDEAQTLSQQKRQ